MALRIRLLPLVIAAGLVVAGASRASSLLDPADVPAIAPGDTLAVIYSGDGGWGGLDQGVAKTLAADGVPVIGVNSLRYFMARRSPQEAAADLAAQLRRHQAQWDRRKIVLVGYSFGADALPVIVPALPTDLRGDIKGVVLIGAGPSGDLKFTPFSWLNRPTARSYAVAPAVEALKGLPLACIYGDKERQDICPSLPATTIRQVRLAGGHHFNGRYERLGRAVLRAVEA